MDDENTGVGGEETTEETPAEGGETTEETPAEGGEETNGETTSEEGQ